MRNAAEAKQLTQRDMSILQWVGQAGIASLDQVARRFWAGKSMETARARTRRLVKAGYLQMRICNVRRPGEAVLCITEAGRELFRSAQRERLQVGLPAPSEIRQQLMAQDAYVLMEAEVREQGGKLVDWRYERELRAELRRNRSSGRGHAGMPYPLDIPDVRLTIATAEGDVEILHVEVDGAYYGKMLCEKARCLTSGGQQVVWVCTQERADYVRKALAGYSSIRILVV